jgi:hypothetical protein
MDAGSSFRKEDCDVNTASWAADPAGPRKLFCIADEQDGMIEGCKADLVSGLQVQSAASVLRRMGHHDVAISIHILTCSEFLLSRSPLGSRQSRRHSCTQCPRSRWPTHRK